MTTSLVLIDAAGKPIPRALDTEIWLRSGRQPDFFLRAWKGASVQTDNWRIDTTLPVMEQALPRDGIPRTFRVIRQLENGTSRLFNHQAMLARLAQNYDPSLDDPLTRLAVPHYRDTLRRDR